MKYCETYESAKSDSKKLSETPVVASASAEHEEMVTSAIGTYKRSKNHQMDNTTTKKCGSCGYNEHDKNKCPAKGKICNACRKPNHFERVCRSKHASNAAFLFNSIDIGISSIGLDSSLPFVRVGIQSDTHQSPIEVDVVADTGVQVMVAGTGHLKTLGIKVENLIEPSLIEKC